MPYSGELHLNTGQSTAIFIIQVTEGYYQKELVNKLMYDYDMELYVLNNLYG